MLPEGVRHADGRVGQLPFLVNPAFLVAILVLSYELSAGVVRGDALVRDNDLRWDLAGQIAGIAPWTCDLASGSLELSRKARDLFDFDPVAPVTIADVVARIHPEDRERVQRALDASVRSEERFEREYLSELMTAHAGNIKQASRSSGIERTQLKRLLRKHGLIS